VVSRTVDGIDADGVTRATRKVFDAVLERLPVTPPSRVLRAFRPDLRTVDIHPIRDHTVVAGQRPSDRDRRAIGRYHVQGLDGLGSAWIFARTGSKTGLRTDDEGDKNGDESRHGRAAAYGHADLVA
jgi:hypothetical protein